MSYTARQKVLWIQEETERVPGLRGVSEGFLGEEAPQLALKDLGKVWTPRKRMRGFPKGTAGAKTGARSIM